MPLREIECDAYLLAYNWARAWGTAQREWLWGDNQERPRQFLEQLGELATKCGANGEEIRRTAGEAASLWDQRIGGQDHREVKAIIEVLWDLDEGAETSTVLAGVGQAITEMLAEERGAHVEGFAGELAAQLRRNPDRKRIEVLDVVAERCCKALGDDATELDRDRFRATVGRVLGLLFPLPGDPDDGDRVWDTQTLADIAKPHLSELPEGVARKFLVNALLPLNAGTRPLADLGGDVISIGRNINDEEATSWFFIGLHLAFLIDGAWLPEGLLRIDKRVGLIDYADADPPDPEEALLLTFELPADILRGSLATRLDSVGWLNEVLAQVHALNDADWARRIHDRIERELPAAGDRDGGAGAEVEVPAPDCARNQYMVRIRGKDVELNLTGFCTFLILAHAAEKDGGSVLTERLAQLLAHKESGIKNVIHRLRMALGDEMRDIIRTVEAGYQLAVEPGAIAIGHGQLQRYSETAVTHRAIRRQDAARRPELATALSVPELVKKLRSSG